ncbi:MAG TPA: crosslink repair DNA glycosylase YcaQ family protein [Rudaea sp.]|nr:crosslink repair DNA glycosylase YcaQ family protein [Rudaea sp.]
MRMLQIDTISVVARSPYLVLFSRLGDYQNHWLDDLLRRGDLFECWGHEACFAPAEDFALHRNDVSHRAHHWAQKVSARVAAENRVELDRLLEHVRKNGPVKASEFEASRPVDKGWWGWKDEKRWLETLFARGDLMIARRENFQRVYDVSERVIARLKKPSVVGDARREFILGGVRALGVTQARWIADYFRTQKTHKEVDLQPFVESGELIRVDVRGWDRPGYAHRDNMALIERAQRSRLRATHTTLLSPFDPIVWDRDRARVMYDFDYTLECYTPAPKRKFGYFVLPILRRGALMGRLDAKAHRADGVFEVKAIYLEPSMAPDDELIDDIAQAIDACARWHGTRTINVRRSDPTSLATKLRASLKRISAF